jgi:predicted MPP superfamily phosphohydrolase
MRADSSFASYLRARADARAEALRGRERLWTNPYGKPQLTDMLFPPFGWSQLFRQSLTTQPTRPTRIRVRRFAGPAIYAGSMEPIRIAHLTDQHVGRVTSFAVQQEAVALTNAEQPDLVVITGDFVCHSQMYLDQLVELVSGFKAPVLGVLGNHDYWAGADEVAAALHRGGVEILRNANTTVSVHGQRLQIVGLDDAYTGHALIDKAVAGLRRDLPALALSHIAEEADQLWQRGIPLVLSGHTHGGQITVARLHEISVGRIGGHKYVHGLYGSRQAPTDPAAGAVYVGAGIGASVIPFRLGERGKREITIFEFGCRPGEFDEPDFEQTPLPGRLPSPAKMRRRAEKVVRKRHRRSRRNTVELRRPPR